MKERANFPTSLIKFGHWMQMLHYVGTFLVS